MADQEKVKGEPAMEDKKQTTGDKNGSKEAAEIVSVDDLDASHGLVKGLQNASGDHASKQVKVDGKAPAYPVEVEDDTYQAFMAGSNFVPSRPSGHILPTEIWNMRKSRRRRMNSGRSTEEKQEEEEMEQDLATFPSWLPWATWPASMRAKYPQRAPISTENEVEDESYPAFMAGFNFVPRWQ